MSSFVDRMNSLKIEILEMGHDYNSAYAKNFDERGYRGCIEKSEKLNPGNKGLMDFLDGPAILHKGSIYAAVKIEGEEFAVFYMHNDSAWDLQKIVGGGVDYTDSVYQSGRLNLGASSVDVSGMLKIPIRKR